MYIRFRCDEMYLDFVLISQNRYPAVRLEHNHSQPLIITHTNIMKTSAWQLEMSLSLH